MDKDRTDNYQLQERLGQGSFGKVYRALKRDTGQIVAIKKIPKNNHSATNLLAFRKELEIHNQLDHPNIIKLIDYYDSNQKLVLIMECAKCSLADLVTPRLPTARVQQMACEISSALFYLHSKRICHRDLKPENVLVGYDDVTKLCDFGFARDVPLGAFLLTSVKGTPIYMAPEIINLKPYDQKADLWSFGCILYALLMGYPPFDSLTLVELNKVVDKPIKWDPRISGDCLDFLKGLLEKDSKKRFDWAKITVHPYVSKGIVYTSEDVLCTGLTKALSPSQEFKKENQRQEYQAVMDKDARTRAMLRSKMYLKTLQPNGLPHHQISKATKIPTGLYPVHQTNQGLPECQTDLKHLVEHGDDEGSISSESSLNTVTSDSSSGNESEDDLAITLVGSRSSGKSCSITTKDSHHTPPSDPWIHGTRLATHISKDDGKEIEEEWLDYINKNVKEVIRNPQTLCEKYSFRLIVQPLRNQHTGVLVLEKIAMLLSLPFALDGKIGLFRDLENVYLESKVVAHLIYASKLVVIRRRIELGRELVCDGELPNILTDEDIDTLAKCIRLVCYLIHSEQRFVVQFCDSVFGFHAYVLFQLFLGLNQRRTELTTDALAILSHLIRTVPGNFSILENILLRKTAGFKGLFVENSSGDDLWALASHRDPGVQSCTLRIIGYLIVHSEKSRDLFIVRNLAKLWGILRTARTQTEPRLVAAAEFVSETLRHLESPPSRRQSQVQQSLPTKFC